MIDQPRSHSSELIRQRNLNALRTVDPSLADCLAAISIPPHAMAAVGRDGSPTFRLHTADGERWLGYTSMPTISGPAMLSNFDPGRGNVVLAGIGQGIEARLLTERLGSNRAVFVLERDLDMLGLVLRLHDLAAAIEQGRLILIAGHDIGEILTRFLREHEGYLVPERLLSWPWMEPQCMEEMTLLLQHCVSRVNRHRAAVMLGLDSARGADREDRESVPERPRTFIICPRAQGESLRLTNDALAGLSRLSWPAVSWIADSPRTAHPLLLVRRMTEFRPELCLLIDAVRANLGKAVPPRLRLASWMSSGVRSALKLADGIGPDDGVFCSDGRLLRDLAGAGIESNRLHWLPPAIAPADVDKEHAQKRQHDLVVVANAHPLAAEANNLTLESHRAAWEAAERLIRQEADRYTDDRADRILSRAEAATGARFGEPSIRAALCDQISAVLGQTLVCQSVCESVLRAGLGLSLWGDGWGDYPSLASAWQGPLNRDRSELYASAKVVLHIDVNGNATCDLITAAASGAVVLARSHPTDEGPNGLAVLLTPGREVLLFKRTSELIAHVKRLLADEALRRTLADRAGARVMAHHTTVHRLTEIRSVMAQD